MATDRVERALEDLNRTLKEISSTLKEQNRILRSLKTPLELKPEFSEPVEKTESEDLPKGQFHPAKIYGWSMAASVQRDGDLNRGDIKIEHDESKWIWTGEAWERIEAPSAYLS